MLSQSIVCSAAEISELLKFLSRTITAIYHISHITSEHKWDTVSALYTIILCLQKGYNILVLSTVV